MDLNEIFGKSNSTEGGAYSSSMGMFENNQNVYNLATDDCEQITASTYMKNLSKENRILSNLKYMYLVKDENVKSIDAKTESVEVFPLVGLASHNIISLNDIRSVYFPNRLNLEINKDLKFNIENLYSLDRLKKPILNVEIYANIPNLKTISGIKSGYVYCIDYNKYKNSIKPRPSDSVFKKFMLSGEEVSYVKKYKLDINYSIKNGGK